MNDVQRVYLDHAATSWPKSEAVARAVYEATTQFSTAGRGAYRSAMAADAIMQDARRALATLVAAPSPACISIHSSGTAALNAAIHGLLKPGDHVVTTAAEHNSVLRPLAHLSEHAGVRVSHVPCDDRGRVSANDVVAAIRDDTTLVAITHASNVTGAVQPVAEIGDHVKSHRAALLIDAAQTVGYLPIDVQAMNADFLAAPGHKGIGGPLGTGFLYASERFHNTLMTTIQGGTGSQSESLEMPSEYPAKVEAGNANVPAIAGLLTALRELQVEDNRVRLRELSRLMHETIDQINGLKLYSDPGELAIASVGSSEISPADLAVVLDTEFRIECRAGFHCAALIHKFLQSEHGGTLRLSAGHASTKKEITMACDALKAIALSVSEHTKQTP